MEIYGRNAYLIVPIVPLSKFGYRLLSCEEELFGTYLITPSNDWYKCEVKNGVPILDLRINVWENTILQERHMDIKIAKRPDFNLNFKNLITSGIIEASPFHTSALENSNFEHRFMSALEASWHGEYNSLDNSVILLDIDLDFDDNTNFPANDLEKVPTKARHHRFSLAPQNTPDKQRILFGNPGVDKLRSLHKFNDGVCINQFPSKTQPDIDPMIGYHPYRSVSDVPNDSERSRL